MSEVWSSPVADVARPPLTPQSYAKNGRDTHSNVREKLFLFNHLVGTNEDRQRHGDAECLSGLEINDQVELIV